jgi:type II secretory pathway pseudopilin PulG
MSGQLALPGAAMITQRLRARLRSEDGQGLIELLAALALLTIAMTALLASFSSSIISLRRAGGEGTALTVADRQMEIYRTLKYSCITLNSGTAPSGCPAATGFPNPYSADQTPSSTDTPDNRTYTVHTDITYSGTAPLQQATVTVTVKDAVGTVRSTQSSLFSQAAFPTP